MLTKRPTTKQKFKTNRTKREKTLELELKKFIVFWVVCKAFSIAWVICEHLQSYKIDERKLIKCTQYIILNMKRINGMNMAVGKSLDIHWKFT